MSAVPPVVPPVVIVAFNRPDLLARTVEQVRGAGATEVFLLVDGPRPDRPDDEVGCRAVRELLDAVEWPGAVHRRYSEVNLGCEGNVETGLDWVFTQVDRAIVLEDDCVPDPTFFPFCAELLERFADDPRVAHVSGNNLLVPEELFTASYAFTAWASVWGWATWARAWNHHRTLFPRTHAGHEPGTLAEPPERPGGADVADGRLVTAGGVRYFTEVAETDRGDLFGWDSHWWVTLIDAGLLSVTPSVGMVHNVGFGEGATNTRSTRTLPPARPMPFPLAHPAGHTVDAAVERELELVLVRANGRLARLARTIVKPMWMRTIARHVLAFPLLWRVVRGASALAGRARSAVSGRTTP